MSPGRLEHPGRWLWLVLLVPVLLGLSRLSLDVEIFHLLPEDLRAVQGLQIHQKHFANSRELILTVSATTAPAAEEGARTIASTLRQRTDLAETVTWQPPWLEHPEWAAELMAYLWLNQPPERFSELSQRLAHTNLAPTLESVRETLASSMSPNEIARLSYDPFGLSLLPDSDSPDLSLAPTSAGFASEDGTVRFVFVQARQELKTYRDCENWLAQVRATVDLAVTSQTAADSAGDPLKIGYTGRPAFVAEIARGMQNDMTMSAGGTAIIIALLFYIWHRRFKPMLWLLILLGTILAGSLGVGGLLYGSLNVVSLGFAAILLGLGVDYAVVHYQEAIASPELSIPEIRHVIAPSITWAAVTTIAAFLTLNFGGLPGLGQLGTLVAAGVTLSAGVMVFEFLPPLFPSRARRAARVQTPAVRGQHSHPVQPRSAPCIVALGASGLVLAAVLLVLTLKGPPAIDPTAEPLRPVSSPAYDAMDLVRKALGHKQEPFWLIVSGTNEQQVATRLAEAERLSREAQSRGLLQSHTIPTGIWPNPSFQLRNLESSEHLVSRRSQFRQAAEAAGFAPASLGLLEGVLDTWSIVDRSKVFWPTNPMSRWILEKLTARTSTNLYALALLTPQEDRSVSHRHGVSHHLEPLFNQDGMWLTGWELLGESIYGRVRSHFPSVLLPMLALVVASLCVAYKRIREVALSLLALSLSVLCLLAVMRVAGWSWNLLNLMAIPLVLGTGVDYGIFMLLGLRRYRGNLMLTNRAVTRALLLCGATAITGFGSLAFSSNAGMAGLGKVCATGIACNMAVALFLLPSWWLRWGATGANAPARPSLLYRAGFWTLGVWLIKRLPHRVSTSISRGMLAAYWWLAGGRRHTVIENLRPVTGGDLIEARLAARRLYRNFADKLTDLLRYEAGLPVEPMLGEATNWDLYQKAREEKRGVLLITPHLGNWEFGAPFLTRMGEDLHVITLAEPGRKFTELRQAARSRRNIKTIVIGDDAFAFLEIIRKLESGATVALLIDRPPPTSSVLVELFGNDFPASVAAAELARASGCVLLPVYVPRVAGKYHAHLLPPIAYNRAELRHREARRELTEQLLHAFEPIIRQYLDQWYHFVPVWAQQRTSRSLSILDEKGNA